MMIQETKELARYVPKRIGKKWITKVTEGGIGDKYNGGIHSLENFQKAIAMLTNAAHTWRSPRLYHLILTGADADQYNAFLAKFCRKLHRADVDAEYVACIEHDFVKRLHMHCFIVIGTKDKKPSRFITIANEADAAKPSTLQQALRLAQVACPALMVRVQRPAMHPTVYMELNQSNNHLLKEACEWISYYAKTRSKPLSGRCYYASKRSKTAGPQVHEQPIRAPSLFKT